MNLQRHCASVPCRSDRHCSCRHCVDSGKQPLDHASCIHWAYIRLVAFGTYLGLLLQPLQLVEPQTLRSLYCALDRQWLEFRVQELIEALD